MPIDADQLDGDTLRRLVARLGIDTEGRLAAATLDDGWESDNQSAGALRPALLRLLTRLGSIDQSTLSRADRASLDTLLGRAGDLCLHLDSMQTVNIPSDDSDELHLQIPLLAEGSLTTADIRIAGNRGGKTQPVDPDNVRLAVDIDLSGLGPLQLGLSVVDRQVTCTIRVDDETRSQFIKGSKDGLRKALQACGYGVAAVSVRSRADLGPDETGARALGVDVRA